MSLIVTPIFAGLCALLFLVLSFNVVKYRRRFKAGMGDKRELQLALAIRAHSNAAEYMPLTLILLGLVEGMGANTWFVHITAVVFLVGRILHAIGISRSGGVSFGRFYGTLMTWIAIAALAGYAIVVPIYNHFAM